VFGQSSVGYREVGKDGLNLSDGFNEILVERDELRLILVVDHDVGEIDEEPLLFVNGIGDTVAHGWNKKVTDVNASHRSDANANLLAFGHGTLLPTVG
jgi:hypothetical protein